MFECNECGTFIAEGEEVFVFTDNYDTYYFCCEVCAANFLGEITTADYDDEFDDEDFDEEWGDDYKIGLGVFLTN